MAERSRVGNPRSDTLVRCGTAAPVHGPNACPKSGDSFLDPLGISRRSQLSLRLARRDHGGFLLLLLLSLLWVAGAIVQAGEPAPRAKAPRSAVEPAARPDASTDLPGAPRAEKPRLRITSSPQTIHGGIQVPTMIVVAEFNKFSFLPPSGWRVTSEASQKRIQLSRPQSGSSITVDLAEESTGQTAERSPEVWLPRITNRFANAKILDQLFLSGLGGLGPALDLEWRATSGSLRRARAGVIPFAGGYLECTLTGPAEKVGQDFQALSQLLLSFRQSPLNGRLELPSVTPE